ncbi:hypothetical protein Tco_0233808 [Tanacetum coccineum]
MSQDQSIPRRNKIDWHMANDDPILTTMRFIPQHEVVQRYGVVLPEYLTNQAMKESEAYKTYHDLATGKVESTDDDDNDAEIKGAMLRKVRDRLLKCTDASTGLMFEKY